MLTLPTRQHRSLLRELVKRDIGARYRGSALGILWALLVPLMQLAVYTFIFTQIFTPRGGVADSIGSYALYLFSGLILHAFLTECLTRAPMILLQHPNYIKKVVFPLPLLPIMPVCSALFHLGMSLAILLAALAWTGQLHMSALLLPLVIAPLVILTLGLSWMLASLGLFFRDIGQIIGLVMMVLLFFSPIFTPLEQFPTRLQPWLFINPLTVPVQLSRELLSGNEQISLNVWILYSAFSFLIMAAGLAWFKRSRVFFADAL